MIRQNLAVLGFETTGKALLEITSDVNNWVRENDMQMGSLTLFCQHTSASLLVLENAAPAVRTDLVHWLDGLAPEDRDYAHDEEGPDDMPAHLKTVLTGPSLSIPVAGGRMMLGTWQGIFLAEHRSDPQRRSIAAHIVGE